MKRWCSALVVVGLLAALFFPASAPAVGRVPKAVEDLAHFPVFLLLGLLLGRWRRGGLVGGVVWIALFAVAVELIQPWTGRETDARDALVSTLGGVSGLLLAGVARAEGRIRLGGALAVLIAFACIAGGPLALILRDQQMARRAFPVLASFERTVELDRWVFRGAVASMVPAGASHGRRALRVEFEPGTAYPGLFMTEVIPDWSGFSRICFDLWWSPQTPRDIWIRADDRREEPAYVDRGQLTFTVTSGWNQVCVALEALWLTPSGRRMDAAKITRWGLFLEAAEGGEVLELDHVRLIRD